ncbi:MAG TPA: signal peptidase II [Micavibrio sp.]|nr:signal peptidase II [Micavibrio sp.]
MSYWKLSTSKPAVGFSLALDVLVLDQISKWLILEYVMRAQVQPNARPVGLWDWLMDAPPRFPFASVEILPFFNLTMVWNQGISFGLFHGSGIWILVGLSLIITVAFSIWMLRSNSWLQIVALALVIGGAVGNVADRLRFGAVADFFDFHVMGWHYPAFNVADCGIVVGIALLVMDGIFFEPKRAKQTEGGVA